MVWEDLCTMVNAKLECSGSYLWPSLEVKFLFFHFSSTDSPSSNCDFHFKHSDPHSQMWFPALSSLKHEKGKAAKMFYVLVPHNEKRE